MKWSFPFTSVNPRLRDVFLEKAQQIISSFTVVVGSGCRELTVQVWLPSAHNRLYTHNSTP